MRKKKTVKRPRPAALSARQLAKRIVAQKSAARAEAKFAKIRRVIGRFRPRKKDYGTIILLGARGSRVAAAKNRRVIAVYVNRKGKKTTVRQYDRKNGRLEKHPKLRKVNTVDVSRVRSKKAQKGFLRATLNRVASGALSGLPPSGKIDVPGRSRKISCAGTRYCGQIFSGRIDRQSEAARFIGAELARAANHTLGKRDFIVTIGISCRAVKTGENFFIVTRPRVSPPASQKNTPAAAIVFMGRGI